jgi:hypothetical protein
MMRKDEMGELVKRVCAVEGKQPSPDLVDAWFSLLNNLDFEVANRAATLALQDHQIFAVAPKNILAKVPAAVAELNAVLRKQEFEDSGRSDPEPVCRDHNLPVTQCGDCCGVLATQVAHLHGQVLHDWAVVNLYRDDREPF